MTDLLHWTGTTPDARTTRPRRSTLAMWTRAPRTDSPWPRSQRPLAAMRHRSCGAGSPQTRAMPACIPRNSRENRGITSVPSTTARAWGSQFLSPRGGRNRTAAPRVPTRTRVAVGFPPTRVPLDCSAVASASCRGRRRARARCVGAVASFARTDAREFRRDPLDGRGVDSAILVPHGRGQQVALG